jgi:hypothetical protein
MLNNKRATDALNILQWINYSIHKCKQRFSTITKNFSTCILFLPSEITKELVKIIVDIKLLSQFTTTTMLLHLVHTIPTHAFGYKFDHNK